ncbi:MAG: ABC transporter permease [Rhodothermales bacterium]
MFDSQAFRTWPLIVLGAISFAVLFGSAFAMGEALFDGSFQVTRTVVGLGAAAFVGYIGVALIVRYEEEDRGQS